MKRYVVSYIKNGKDRMYYAVKNDSLCYYDTKNKFEAKPFVTERDAEIWVARMKAQKDSTESDYKIEEIEITINQHNVTNV